MKICLLCGGVGGARAALALAEHLPAENLTFVVNTGDDFCHLGLHIWPDWDTVVYTLSGLVHAARGWGREDEGTRAMEELSRLSAPDWFHLGDRDLALHVVRTWALGQGRSADQVAADIAGNLGVKPRVLRVTQETLATELVLAGGARMDFQDWFVRYQGKPEVAGVESVKDAMTITTGVLRAIADCDLLLIAPSNPYLSIFPMLGLSEVAKAVKDRSGPTWAVSPLLGGKAVKGPLDALLAALSLSQGQQAIVDVYGGWAQCLLLPEPEHAGLSPGSLVLQSCRTWLGRPEQRAEFVEDLLAAWKAPA